MLYYKFNTYYYYDINISQIPLIFVVTSFKLTANQTTQIKEMPQPKINSKFKV